MRIPVSLRIAAPALLLATALIGCTSSSPTAAGPTGPGALSLTGSTTGAAQLAGVAIIPVTRTGGSSGAVTVSYATSDGTAISGLDYTAASSTISWADGDSATKNIVVPVSTTLGFYGTRTFNVTLSAPTGSATLVTSATQVNITGDPVQGTLGFTSSTAATSVVNGSITLAVNRTVGMSGSASINYATADGTATAGMHYTATSGTLNWADGDSAPKNITVPLSSSFSFTGTATFTVTLSAPLGSVGTPTLGTSKVTVSLTTSPLPGTLGFAATTTAVTQTPAGNSASISVARTSGTVGAVGVSYATTDGTATAGTQYTATSGTLSWAAGDSTAKTITVPLSQVAFNGTKTFTLTLSAPTGTATLGTSTNTVTITGAWAAAPSTCSYNFNPWKLQLPIDQFGGAGGTNGIQYAAIEANTTQIKAAFADPFFYADASCNIIFTAPVVGAVTTPGVGSDHTRSELRELYTGTGADSNSDWNSAIGGTLTATGQVIAVSSHSDEATIAQIHGQSLVFMLLLFRPTNHDIAVDIYNTNTSGSTHTRTSIATAVNVGSTFTYSIKYLANTITVTVNGNTMNFPIDSSWAGSPMYFKLGAYHAANPSYGAIPADETVTSFSAFAVSH